jgi:hypothetical protein
MVQPGQIEIHEFPFPGLEDGALLLTGPPYIA